MEAIVAALVVVVGFGTSLLVWFHYQDRKDAQIHPGDY